jgi:hypothetical protein
MITETTRACSACRNLIDDADAKCPKCGRIPCPRVELWPEGARRLLFLFLLTDALATKLDATEQQQMEWLLENVMRGRYYGGRVLPRSAPAADCYPFFIELLEEWKACDSPNEVNAIAQLRGAR